MIITCIGPENTDMSENQKKKCLLLLKELLKNDNGDCDVRLAFPTKYGKSFMDAVKAVKPTGDIKGFMLFAESPDIQDIQGGVKHSAAYYKKKRNENLIKMCQTVVFFGTGDNLVKENVKFAENKNKTIYYI